MEYAFFSESDEKLIETSELPIVNGITVAFHTTGHDIEADEIVELCICDLKGTELFFKRVKPQNVEEWTAGEASGGISMADVADSSELYQFEEEISKLFEEASIVVAEHVPFLRSMFSASWITLPEFAGFDILEQFRTSHSTSDYPGHAATVATLPAIAEYYQVAGDDGPSGANELEVRARTIGACYRALVEEHAREREAKGAAYWEAREKRLAEQNAASDQAAAATRMREHRYNQMNALLWIAGGIIFTSLAIQSYQAGRDMGFIIICVAAAVFTFSRGVINWRK